LRQFARLISVLTLSLKGSTSLFFSFGLSPPLQDESVADKTKSKNKIL